MSWFDESDARILFEEGLGPDPDGEPGCLGCLGIVLMFVVMFALFLVWMYEG